MKQFISLVMILVYGSHLLQAQLVNTHLDQLLLHGHNYSETGITIQLPSVSGSLISSGFALGDIYEAENKTLRLDEAADLDTDFHALASARLSYGGLTWHREGWGITLGHEWILDAGANVPESTFDLIVDGNANLERSTFEVSGKYQTAHKINLGAYKSWDNAVIGINAHYISGVETLFSEDFKVDLVNDDDFFTIELYKDIEVKSSGVINYNAADDITVTADSQVFTASPITSNGGVGFTIYGRAVIGDRGTIYGVIDDIGIVNWRRQAVTYEDRSEVSYEGLNIREAYISDNEYSVRDTLYSLLSIDKNVASFSSYLSPSFMIGSEYEIADNLDVVASLSGKYINDGFRSIVKLGGRYRFDKLGTLSINGLLAGGSFFNIGLGYHKVFFDKFGFYVNTTNPWSLSNYYSFRYGDFSAGMYYRI